ncbi:hypothetical protein NDI76_08550 [Halogeometricum sp. S1BR25-6]|uniref:DUF8215 domain-containing protein n=1 Tax=Halogeometricum salsisoli TaxID=2950536 RepID=A0ABU2GEB1_9EURY|nr:hypothetical protein [Halogeometricum sp. S1BR25-6]MDS0298791.1 hypothetical protein [Halogeometricum sp. S1BR25-6]
MSRGATDPETEARQVRAREENDELGRWLENLFDGTAEATVLGLPVLVGAAFSGGLLTSSAALGAAVALSFGVAAYRNGSLTFGPGWPPFSLFYVGVRTVWYNLAYVAAVYAVVGTDLFASTPSSLALAIVAGAAVATVAVLTFPFVANGVESARRL